MIYQVDIFGQHKHKILSGGTWARHLVEKTSRGSPILDATNTLDMRPSVKSKSTNSSGFSFPLQKF